MVTLCQDLFHEKWKVVMLLETFKELIIGNVCLIIGDKGTIINKQTDKIIKQHVSKCGYLAINIQTKPKPTSD